MSTRSQVSTANPPEWGDEVEDPSIEYPDSDGEPMADNDWQFTALTNTASALRVRYQDRPDVYVAGDMLVYYRMNDNQTRVAPDVYVVFGAAGNHRRRSWRTWQEGKPPDFVLEVASPGTWERDAGKKREIYAEMGVTEYWRFDPTGDCFTPSLVGERLENGQYREIPLSSEDGILRGYSELLGLDLCVLPGLELRLYDPVTGEWLHTHQESEAARQVEAAARQVAETAREAAEDALIAEQAARQAAEDEARILRERLRELEARGLSD